MCEKPTLTIVTSTCQMAWLDRRIAQRGSVFADYTKVVSAVLDHVVPTFQAEDLEFDHEWIHFEAECDEWTLRIRHFGDNIAPIILPACEVPVKSSHEKNQAELIAMTARLVRRLTASEKEHIIVILGNTLVAETVARELDIAFDPSMGEYVSEDRARYRVVAVTSESSNLYPSCDHFVSLRALPREDLYTCRKS